jgi:hypothetical protein
MGTLIDTLEASGGASAIWNEFEITVAPSQWEHEATGAAQSGWIVQVKDFLVASDPDVRQRGMRSEIVRNHRITAWDDLIGVMAELGVPDKYEGWR